MSVWEKGDEKVMWQLIDVKSKCEHLVFGFIKDYSCAYCVVMVKSVDVGCFFFVSNGVVMVLVIVKMCFFGMLYGIVCFLVYEEGETVWIVWTLDMRLLGFKGREEVRCCSGPMLRCGSIYDVFGCLFVDDLMGALIVGVFGDKPIGLECIYDDRLGGRLSSTLKFGDCMIVKVPCKSGYLLYMTIWFGF